MKNEWRENFWLVLELFIVFLAIWLIAMFLVLAFQVRHIRRGFESEDVLYMNVTTVNDKSPSYIDFGENAPYENAVDLKVLINELRHSPYVDYAAFSANGIPYNFSYWGYSFKAVGDSMTYNCNTRFVSPDMAMVLRYESLDGKSCEELRDILAKGEILLSPSLDYPYKGYPESDTKVGDLSELFGRRLTMGNDSTTEYVSHAAIHGIKRGDFESSLWSGTAILPIDEDNMVKNGNLNIWNIAVRLRPGTEQAFREQFRNTPSMRGRRNVYLSQPFSLQKAGEGVNRESMIGVRVWVAGAMFLLAVVFLCVLGTFWYRIRRREKEIAIRMVNGASAGDIFRRFLSESMILVGISVLSAIVAVLSIVLIVGKEEIVEMLSEMMQSVSLTHVIVSWAAAVVCLVAVVVAAIIIPARRAMKVEPAIALKDE